MAGPNDELSAADVAKVARLARLVLTPAEAEAARVSMAAVLGYMDRLGALDLAGVEPLAHMNEGGGMAAATGFAGTSPARRCRSKRSQGLPRSRSGLSSACPRSSARGAGRDDHF